MSARQQLREAPLWLKLVFVFFVLGGLAFLFWLFYHFFIQPPPVLVLCVQPVEKLTLTAPLVLVSPTLPPTPLPTYTPTPPSGLPTPIPRLPNGDWPPLGIFPPPRPTPTLAETKQAESGMVKVSCPSGEGFLLGRFRGNWRENDGQLQVITVCFALRAGKAITFRGVEKNSLALGYQPAGTEDEMRKQLQLLAVRCQQEEGEVPLVVVLPDESSRLGPFLVRVENVSP